MTSAPPYPCPACGHRVFTEPPGSYETCPVCDWEDDAAQLANPTLAGGANHESLVEAQARIGRQPPVSNAPRDPSWRLVSDDEVVWYRAGRDAAHLPQPREADEIYYWRAPFEAVLTVPDYYDGARAGLAMFRGQPHYFASRFSDLENEYEDVFDLWPVDEETLGLAMEDWAIWCRWFEAFHAGTTTLETHPALPEDRERWSSLQARLEGRLPPKCAPTASAYGDFRGDVMTCSSARVRWCEEGSLCH